MKNIKDYKVNELHIGDLNYPKELYDLDDPPKILYYIGNIDLLEKRRVAVVGSRKTSDYGYWVATSISELLSKNGITIVAGMARGIDSFAHNAAIPLEGRTIAVLGTGIDVCYPARNIRIMEAIAERGLIISEYGRGYSGAKWTFPKRNRIICALSEAVIIAEAGLQSGAMITADIADKLNKRVYAVPGNINNEFCKGSNQLLCEGAIPIVSFTDLKEDFKIEQGKNKKVDLLGNDELLIYKELQKNGEMTVEELCEKINLEPQVINGIVTILELKGIAITSLGKIFIAN